MKLKLKRIKTIKANRNNYGRKRKYKDIKAIVIHNTGNVGDTALNNANYFKNNDFSRTDYNRSAHFFIDQNGEIIKSVLVRYVAYSVKDINPTMYNNANTVSIELCDIATKDIGEKQLESLKYLIKRLKKKIGNVPIIRHYDVNGKQCPIRYLNPIKWEELRKELLK